MQTKVFGRSNPQQKLLIVSELQSLLSQNNKNDFIGFCGDGANDCLALKQANVGLSLALTEASIAAPFSTTCTDISAVVQLLIEEVQDRILLLSLRKCLEPFGIPLFFVRH